MADLQEWVSRTTSAEDDLSRAHARGLAALLDRDPDALGRAVPEGWHWIYFRPATRPSDVGPDGHARRGGFLPPVPLPRRMWVGGRIRFVAPLPFGAPAVRRSTVRSVTAKRGRAGELVFVTVRHEIATADGVAVDEEQDLVYREPASPGEPPRPAQSAPTSPDWSETFTPDAVTLFRFSALTYNGHRIHWDHPYATRVEGYPGLVVHAPLTALLLLEAAKRHRTDGTAEARPAAFEYRAVSPLFCDEPMTLAGRTRADEPTTEVWAAGPDGVAMTGRVEWGR